MSTHTTNVDLQVRRRFAPMQAPALTQRVADSAATPAPISAERILQLGADPVLACGGDVDLDDIMKLHANKPIEDSWVAHWTAKWSANGAEKATKQFRNETSIAYMLTFGNLSERLGPEGNGLAQYAGLFEVATDGTLELERRGVRILKRGEEGFRIHGVRVVNADEPCPEPLGRSDDSFEYRVEMITGTERTKKITCSCVVELNTDFATFVAERLVHAVSGVRADDGERILGIKAYWEPYEGRTNEWHCHCVIICDPRYPVWRARARQRMKEVECMHKLEADFASGCFSSNCSQPGCKKDANTSASGSVATFQHAAWGGAYFVLGDAVVLVENPNRVDNTRARDSLKAMWNYERAEKKVDTSRTIFCKLKTNTLEVLDRNEVLAVTRLRVAEEGGKMTGRKNKQTREAVQRAIMCHLVMQEYTGVSNAMSGLASLVASTMEATNNSGVAQHNHDIFNLAVSSAPNNWKPQGDVAKQMADAFRLKLFNANMARDIEPRHFELVKEYMLKVRIARESMGAFGNDPSKWSDAVQQKVVDDCLYMVHPFEHCLPPLERPWDSVACGIAQVMLHHGKGREENHHRKALADKIDLKAANVILWGEANTRKSSVMQVFSECPILSRYTCVNAGGVKTDPTFWATEIGKPCALFILIDEATVELAADSLAKQIFSGQTSFASRQVGGYYIPKAPGRFSILATNEDYSDFLTADGYGGEGASSEVELNADDQQKVANTGGMSSVRFNETRCNLDDDKRACLTTKSRNLSVSSTFGARFPYRNAVNPVIDDRIELPGGSFKEASALLRASAFYLIGVKNCEDLENYRKLHTPFDIVQKVAEKTLPSGMLIAIRDNKDKIPSHLPLASKPNMKRQKGRGGEDSDEDSDERPTRRARRTSHGGSDDSDSDRADIGFGQPMRANVDTPMSDDVRTREGEHLGHHQGGVGGGSPTSDDNLCDGGVGGGSPTFDGNSDPGGVWGGSPTFADIWNQCGVGGGSPTIVDNSNQCRVGGGSPTIDDNSNHCGVGGGTPTFDETCAWNIVAIDFETCNLATGVSSPQNAPLSIGAAAFIAGEVRTYHSFIDVSKTHTTEDCSILLPEFKRSTSKDEGWWDGHGITPEDIARDGRRPRQVIDELIEFVENAREGKDEVAVVMYNGESGVDVQSLVQLFKWAGRFYPDAWRLLDVPAQRKSLAQFARDHNIKVDESRTHNAAYDAQILLRSLWSEGYDSMAARFFNFHFTYIRFPAPSKAGAFQRPVTVRNWRKNECVSVPCSRDPHIRMKWMNCGICFKCGGPYNVCRSRGNCEYTVFKRPGACKRCFSRYCVGAYEMRESRGLQEYEYTGKCTTSLLPLIDLKQGSRELMNYLNNLKLPNDMIANWSPQKLRTAYARTKKYLEPSADAKLDEFGKPICQANTTTPGLHTFCARCDGAWHQSRQCPFDLKNPVNQLNIDKGHVYAGKIIALERQRTADLDKLKKENKWEEVERLLDRTPVEK